MASPDYENRMSIWGDIPVHAGGIESKALLPIRTQMPLGNVNFKMRGPRKPAAEKVGMERGPGKIGFDVILQEAKRTETDIQRL